MWVRVRKRGKNKEKCVNRATFLTGTSSKVAVGGHLVRR
jgi:hypothetical protein